MIITPQPSGHLLIQLQEGEVWARVFMGGSDQYLFGVPDMNSVFAIRCETPPVIIDQDGNTLVKPGMEGSVTLDIERLTTHRLCPSHKTPWEYHSLSEVTSCLAQSYGDIDAPRI